MCELRSRGTARPPAQADRKQRRRGHLRLQGCRPWWQEPVESLAGLSPAWSWSGDPQVPAPPEMLHQAALTGLRIPGKGLGPPLWFPGTVPPSSAALGNPSPSQTGAPFRPRPAAPALHTEEGLCPGDGGGPGDPPLGRTQSRSSLQDGPTRSARHWADEVPAADSSRQTWNGTGLPAGGFLCPVSSKDPTGTPGHLGPSCPCLPLSVSVLGRPAQAYPQARSPRGLPGVGTEGHTRGPPGGVSHPPTTLQSRGGERARQRGLSPPARREI